jgi:predicted enzyme related to lactoylglutathione lyase
MNSNRQTTPINAQLSFGLVTERFYETWDFYTEHLRFRTLEESDDALVLVHPSGVRLGILRHETDAANPERVSATDGRGFWLNLAVEDVEAEFEHLSKAGALVVHALGAGEHTSPSFTLRDPNGVLIFVTQETASHFWVRGEMAGEERALSRA